jgi:hypothetical protein
VRRGLIAGVVALCLSAPVGAQAADLFPRGSLIVRWSSNPATCDSYGLCGRSGTLSWSPSRGAFETFDRRRGANLAFFDSAAIARSRRETDSGPRVCVEATDALFELNSASSKRGAVMTFDKDTGLDFGRCAGPLPRDFAAAMPRSQPFNAAGLARRGGTIDMRSRGQFAAGPFSGEVLSSLQFRVKPTRSEAVSRTHAAPAHTARTRPPFSVIELQYAIERIDGQMTLGFDGTSDAVCEIFDVCGLHGEIAIGGNATPGNLRITTGRDLRRGQRETPESALRALHAGKIRAAFPESSFGDGASDYTAPPPTARFDFTERSGTTDGPQCSDSGSFEIDGLGFAVARAGLTVSVPRSPDGLPDEMRTHCPGPEERDLGTDLAEGLLPWSVLGDPEITVRLMPGDALRSLAFGGAWQGQYDVVLRRVSFEVHNRPPLKVP